VNRQGRYGNLLRVREAAEQERRRDVAVLLARARALASRLRERASELQALDRELALQTGSQPAAWAQRRERRRTWLRAALEDVRAEMTGLEQELRDAQRTLTEAGRDTKAVERLRDRDREAHAQRARALEQAQHDLLALLRHMRGGS